MIKGLMVRESDEVTKEKEDLGPHQNGELELTIHEFDKVIEEPSGLPPKRDYEQAKTLQPRARLVSVRPYRYAHHHKDNTHNGETSEFLTGETPMDVVAQVLWKEIKH